MVLNLSLESVMSMFKSFKEGSQKKSRCTFSTYTAEVPFQNQRHRITKQLKDYTKDLLLWGPYT